MRVLKVCGSLVFLLALFSAKSSSAQGAAKDGVRLTCSCDDSVGKAYAKALRIALAESKHFREIGAGDEVEQEPIRINIVSLPIGEGANGQPRTALSIVSIHGGAITHQLIETCDKISVESSAQTMLVELVSWK
jgi:hypothetical protein